MKAHLSCMLAEKCKSIKRKEERVTSTCNSSTMQLIWAQTDCKFDFYQEKILSSHDVMFYSFDIVIGTTRPLKLFNSCHQQLIKVIAFVLNSDNSMVATLCLNQSNT